MSIVTGQDPIVVTPAWEWYPALFAPIRVDYDNKSY